MLKKEKSIVESFFNFVGKSKKDSFESGFVYGVGIFFYVVCCGICVGGIWFKCLRKEEDYRQIDEI